MVFSIGKTIFVFRKGSFWILTYSFDSSEDGSHTWKTRSNDWNFWYSAKHYTQEYAFLKIKLEIYQSILFYGFKDIKKVRHCACGGIN